MTEKLYKLYQLQKKRGRTFRVGWAINTDRLSMDGHETIDQQHKYYDFMKWAYKNPPDFPPIFPERLLDRLNDAFKNQKSPSWESLIEKT
ncbi:MAG: hypothetical protein HKM93_17790 [Desulfobacteraceae bacterium]|nr:hypothetical protein [Desulfobacteraceae bacterium]